MWANSVFEALGCPFWPSPPAPPPHARGDSGERLWPLIAVLGYCEQLFGPPLNARGEGRGLRERGDSGERLWQCLKTL
jgi:hypothetical protein